MRIYCYCNRCAQKIYLASQAKSRIQLANSWGKTFRIKCNSCGSVSQVDINKVFAQSSKQNIPFMTALGGGAIGVIAGPLGIAIGLVTGTVSGGIVRQNDQQEVVRFNNSFV